MILTADFRFDFRWAGRSWGGKRPLASPLRLPTPAQRPQLLARASAAVPEGRPELEHIVEESGVALSGLQLGKDAVNKGSLFWTKP